MKDTIIIILLILLISLSCLPLFKNIQNINFHWDWLQMLSYFRASRQSLLQDYQFPLRTYYFGGGYPLLANPQDPSFSLFLIPVLIFGEVLGLKINVFLFHLLGVLGMYYLTRCVLNYNTLGAAFSSIVFGLAGHAHRLLIRGQDYIPTSFYFFIPLVLALFIKSKGDKRYLIFTVLVFTVIAMQAGLYLAPLLLFIFLFSLLELLRWENKKMIFDPAALKNFFFVISVSFLLGAVKFLPMLELLKQNPRQMDGYNPFWGPLWPNIFKAFFVHQRSFPYIGMHWNYFYIGYVPVLLSFAAFLVFWRRNMRYLILGIIFALLSFGARTPLDLFRFLGKLPLFHSIEAPTRYFVSYVTFILALASGSLFLIQQRFKLWVMTPALILCVGFVGADLFFTNSTRDVSFPAAIPKYDYQQSFFSVKNLKPGTQVSSLIPSKMFQTRSWEWTFPTQYELMLQNIGKINAYVNIHLRESSVPKYLIGWNGSASLEPKNFTWHLNPDYRGEIAFLNNPGNAAAFRVFNANKMVAKVSVIEPDTLIINQNYDKSWRTNLGRPKNYNGLLALDLDKKGEYLVSFTYRPVSFILGLVVSLVTLISMMIYWLSWYSRHEKN
ncbi:MAG: hypothetical protein ABIG31_04430 [Candidatus Omnitrophota bacterium]